MPAGIELEARVAELKDQGLNADDIAETILAEDIDSPTGELIRLLEMKPFDLGRIKNKVKRKLGLTPGVGGGVRQDEWYSNLPPLAQAFFEAANKAIPRSPERVRALTDIFAKNVKWFAESRTNFRSWISKYGLPSDAIAQMEDELYGFDFGAGQLGGFQPGQPQVIYQPQWTPQGLQYVPIVVTAQPSQPPGNISITVPQTGPSAQPPGETPKLPEVEAIKEDMASLKQSMSDLSDKIWDLGTRFQPSSLPPASPTPQVKYKRVPMVIDGKVMKDDEGNIVYEEIPYDEGEAKVIDIGRALSEQRQQFIEELNRREAAKERDEKIKETIFAELDRRGYTPRQPTVSDEEKIMMKAEERARQITEARTKELDELRAKVSELTREAEIKEHLDRALAPLRERLQELEGIRLRGGLTDTQSLYAHRETMSAGWLQFFETMGAKLDTSVKTLILNTIIPQLKAIGVSDEVIKEIVRAAGTGALLPEPTESGLTGSSLSERAKEFARKYIKPEYRAGIT